MKIGLFGTVLAAAFCVAAAGPAALVDFGAETPALEIHRAAENGQTGVYRTLPDGKRGLRFEWDNGSANHFEFVLKEFRKLPEFDAAEIRVTAYLPPEGTPRTLNVRLRDRDGEMFQFSQPVPAEASGWREFRYRIDPLKPDAGSWYGGKKANKKIDFPACFAGFAGDFRSHAGTGWIGLEKVEFTVTSAPPLLSLDTGKGSAIGVLTPGEEKRLSLRLENRRPGTLTPELSWSITDVSGKAAGEGKWSQVLESGKTAEIPLPPPRKFGVYYLDLRLKESAGAAADVRRLSYAYLAPAGPVAGKREEFVFGICAHLRGKPAEEQRREAMAAAWCGATLIRDDASWGRIQPKPGEWRFEVYDPIRELLAEYGLEWAPILNFPPLWSRAADSRPRRKGGCHRPEYHDWARFVRGFAAHYRGKIRSVEIWNQPDHPGFANFSGEEYVELLKTAYREIKAVAPELSVLSGGVAGLQSEEQKRLFRLILESKSCDMLAFHGHGGLGGYRPQVANLLKLRREAGADTPWFANETAISAILIGELRQAEILFQKFLYSWANGASGYNWYDLRNDGDDPGNNEHNFGLLPRDIRPKAAYAAYNMLANHYRGAEFLRPLAFGNGVEAFLFRGRDGKLLLAVWSNDAGADGIPLRLAGVTGMAAEIDLFGNMTPLPVRRGELAFKAGRRPATVRVEADAAGLQPGGAFLRSGAEFTVTPGSESTVTPEFVNPTGRPLAVKLAWKTPAGVTVRDAVRSLRLKPGEARKVPVRLAVAETFTPPEREPAVLQLGLELGALWKGSVGWPLHPVVRLAQGVPRTPTFVLRDASQVIPFVPNVPDKAHLFWKNAADLSAEIRLGRDKEALLFEAAVTDDVHHQPYAGAEAWKGDNIQIAMKLPGQNGLWELGLSRLRDNSGEAFCWLAPAGFPAEKTAAAIRLETSRDERAKRTVYRAAIPFRAIGLTEAAARRGFRFNLIVNDNDGEMRESCIGIAPGIAEDKDPERYPTLVIP